MMNRFFFIICTFFLFTCWSVFSQESTLQPSPTPQPTQIAGITIVPGQTVLPQATPPVSQNINAGKITAVPEEYDNKEFSEWELDLRRAEIIFIGAIPLTFFLATEAYDTFRFTYYGVTDSIWDNRYAPWPFNAPDKLAYEEDDKVLIIISALSAAFITAAVDYVIGKIKHRDLRSQKLY